MKPVSDRTLERYLLKELSRSERQRVEQLLQDDETARARLEELERSNEEILEQYPVSEMVPAIHQRLGEAQTRREGNIIPFPPRLARLVPAVAVAAALLILAFPVRQALLGSGLAGGDTTRMKGLDARIEIYRSGLSGPERLQEGATAGQGDLLRLSYVAGGTGHGVIFSVDGNGVITYHLPEQATGDAPPLVPGGEIPLEFSYQLDDAPSFERFFFVTSQDPFSLQKVDRAARRLADDPERAIRESLRLGRGLDQYSLTLRKGDAE
jgi:hypothetical protein